MWDVSHFDQINTQIENDVATRSHATTKQGRSRNDVATTQ